MDDGSDKAYSQDLTNRGARMSSSSFPPTTTSVHVTALDGLVNVNSLFTIAVFRRPVPNHPGATQPREPRGLRRGDRRRQEAPRLRGGLLQLFPLLLDSRPGA